MKKRILSMLCSIAVLCTIFAGVANAEENELKMVDGSYLTTEDSSTGTSVPNGARGEYLMTGECTISNAGLTRVYAYASTTANQKVNFLATIVYVDQYDEDADAWSQVYAWVEEAHDDYFMSTDAAVTVEPGYYYRVRAIHIGGDQYPYDETASFTDGILLPAI